MKKIAIIFLTLTLFSCSDNSVKEITFKEKKQEIVIKNKQNETNEDLEKLKEKNKLEELKHQKLEDNKKKRIDENNENYIYYPLWENDKIIEEDIYDLKLVDVSLFQWINAPESTMINEKIAEDLKEMTKEYNLANNKLLNITSAYRSVVEQKELEIQFIKQGKGHLVAKPWSSEHHLWTAVDFSWNQGVTNFNWLVQNSWKYGFIQSFPEWCIQRTWIANEVWHYRWIWKEKASDYYNNAKPKKSCLIDYLWNLFDENKIETKFDRSLRELEELSF